MKRAALALMLLVLLVPTETAEDGTILVFILAGQSNANGYGVKWKAARGLYNPPSEGSLLHYCQGNPARPRCSPSWVPLGGPEHHSLPSLGPELALGAAAHAHLQTPVGIIKVAFNGTALGQHEKPDWNTASAELFPVLLERVRLALRDLPSHLAPRLAGFFWMQGESDALDGPGQPGMADRYEKNLHDLIRKLRLELEHPELPVVIARISPPERTRRGVPFNYRSTVQEAQHRLAMTEETTGQVETADLPRQKDHLHFTAEGQYLLGRRFFNAWMALVRRDLQADPATALPPSAPAGAEGR